MTEQEFIERYVADNGGRIETGVYDHNLSRHEMVRCTVEHAREAWALLHHQLGEQQEPDEEDVYVEHISRENIQNNNIYVGIPEYGEEDASFRKVIFCPCGHFDGGVYVRFALYDERGDYKLVVKDNAVPHAVSYHSDKCVCMAKDTVGVIFDELPKMHFRRISSDEDRFLHQILDSTELSLAADASGMWLRERLINGNEAL